MVVTSSTADQANIIVEKKILAELIKKLSPYLLYLYENNWLEVKKPGDGYIIENKLNNSMLMALGPVESSRGNRSNFTIYDEVAIMKKSAIDQIFDGMLYPRQPVYLSNPKYGKDKRWYEESKSIYLTSAKFKYMWWYNTWKKCVKGYYTSKKSRYNVFATDIFDIIDNGLKTWGDYRRAKSISDDFSFRMEYLNEAIGESDDAFFTLESFKDNQTMAECFRPPSPLDFYMDNCNNPEKEENELRLIIVDYAFASNTTNAKNDNTIIMCMSLHWRKSHFERHVDYIEGWPASDSIGACDRARTLFWDYHADYFVEDNRSGGETSIRCPYTVMCM